MEYVSAFFAALSIILAAIVSALNMVVKGKDEEITELLDKLDQLESDTKYYKNLAKTFEQGYDKLKNKG